MNLSVFKGNWVDLIILVILLYYVFDAWKYGFWLVLVDFIGFLLSILIALRGYSIVSTILKTNFSLPHSLANALGFLIVAGFMEAILSFILANFARKVPAKLWRKPWNNIFAIFPALGQGMILVSFILTFAIGLPINPNIKSDINESKIGGFLVDKTSGIEVKLNEIFGGLIEDSLTYLTVKPGSESPIPLNVHEKNLTVDEAGERDMVNLVNQERLSRGINALKLRPELVPVARAHAKDMWERNYFGHVSPEGKDVGSRLSDQGVNYTIAGENLALAPTLKTAHTGLMNSEGHRRNILDPDFKRIGIGVIDNGIYGKMFVQIFTN